MPIRIYELPCMDGRKSFYGKAHVIECGDEIYLQSYDTTVCVLTRDGVFTRLWGGYSATTMRHIRSFLRLLGIEAPGTKAWWDGLSAQGAFALGHTLAKGACA